MSSAPTDPDHRPDEQRGPEPPHPTDGPPPGPERKSRFDFGGFLRNARATAKGGGDVNTVRIGEGATVDQIAVGRNILQAKVSIGTLVVPVRFLLALLAVAAAVAVVVWYVAVPSQIPAAASVAVVDFGEKQNGRVADTAEGRRYARYLADQMNDEARSFPPNGRPEVWQITAGFDPVAAFWKRITSGPVADTAGADRVADAFGAKVVVYGFLERAGAAVNLTPQFKVRQAPGEADELSDPQQMGQGIVIDTENEQQLSGALYPLGRALLWMVPGLWAELNGNFILAYSTFKQAEEKLRPETEWPRALGKEVLYYFVGDTALFLSGCESDARQVFTAPGSSAVEQALNAADAAFQESRQIAEEQGRPYPRAYFGLAQVSYQRAQRLLFPPGQNTAGQCRIPATTSPSAPDEIPQYACPAPPAPQDPDALAQAMAQARVGFENAVTLLDKALSLPQPEAPSRLTERARAARANAEVTLAALDLQAEKSAEAETRLRTQIAELESVLKAMDPEDKRARSETYFVLGTAHNYLANARAKQGDTAAVKPELTQARDALDACMKTIGNPRFQSDAFRSVSILPNCYCVREGVVKTLEGLP